MLVFSNETIKLLNKLKDARESAELSNDIETLVYMNNGVLPFNYKIINNIIRKYYDDIVTVSNLNDIDHTSVNLKRPIVTMEEEISNLVKILGIYRYLKSKSKEDYLDILSKNNFVELFINSRLVQE